jgi:glycerol-3-phosphate dehydrogenase (NAD(P)+)
MDKEKPGQPPIAVLGAGSFGSSVAFLLSYNHPVVIYTRREDLLYDINHRNKLHQYDLSQQIRASSDLSGILKSCSLVFPVVPSASFRSLIRECAPYLKPHHILIHGTKGFDYHSNTDVEDPIDKIDPWRIKTMSEVIQEESIVVRVGCLSGPNLAGEIMRGFPAASVVASKFSEVIKIGQEALNSPKFSVFGSHDIKGAELSGALKNIIGLGAGIINGLGLGKNLEALLITRGLREMILIGKHMGSESKAFLGTAGIGDLIATATSELSRNFSFGQKIGLGFTKEKIVEEGHELAEGVRTLSIIRQYNKYYGIDTPIIEMLYQVVHQNFPAQRALHYLMKYPYVQDVDFL